MGNYLQKEIICNECKRQNIKPDFFQREIMCRESGDKTILIEILPIIEKIDKYGKILSDEPIKNMINVDIIKYTCSNNHVINFTK